MYKVFSDENSKVPVKAWVDGVEFEEQALKQALNVSSLPFIYKHVAAMSDSHWGNGCNVGAVIATRKVVIPATVGVDLSCGVIAAKLPLNVSQLINLPKIREEIEKAIPHGRTDHGGNNDKGSWGWDSPKIIGSYWGQIESNLDKLIERHPKIDKRNARRQLSSLGTGNHFISICTSDKDSNVWVMLHSGSRGIGNQIGSYFIELAKQDMRKYFINLPDENLAYIPEGTEYFDDYIEGMEWAKRYAELNRELMLRFTVEALYKALNINQTYDEISFPYLVRCNHNFTALENHFGQNVWVTRKGAVRARVGDMAIIPGCMGGLSFIVTGKGNPESFMSCSHGCGRVMSRTRAKKEISLADHIKATEGVECRKDLDVLDESPAAYKDIYAVMKAQEDLVNIIFTLKEIVNIKG